MKPKFQGVCAICKVAANPKHFHSEAHLDKARIVAKREAETDPGLRILQAPLGLGDDHAA